MKNLRLRGFPPTNCLCTTSTPKPASATAKRKTKTFTAGLMQYLRHAKMFFIEIAFQALNKLGDNIINFEQIHISISDFNLSTINKQIYYLHIYIRYNYKIAFWKYKRWFVAWKPWENRVCITLYTNMRIFARVACMDLTDITESKIVKIVNFILKT